MRFARVTFTAAGVWGVVVLTPLYFLVDVTGRHYAPPSDHPHFFYGFFSVAMAWQIAFFVIGSNPVRFRPLMLPALIEKLGYVATVVVLLSQGRISTTEAATAWPDLLLSVFFVAAFAKTPASPGLHAPFIAVLTHRA